MSVASKANTSILLRMLSSRSARSSPDTACSHEVTRVALEVGLVRRGAVDRGDGGAVEPQVYGELAAVVHQVVEHGATVHGELWVRRDGPAADLERPRLLELRIRSLGERGARRGRVAVEQLENPRRAVEGLELGRRPTRGHDVELVASDGVH